MAEGLAKGMAEGLEKGMAEGRAKGLEAGRAESLWNVALKMKQDGLDASFIAKFTGLPEEEINNLNPL